MSINQEVLVKKLFSLLQFLKNFEKKFENLFNKYFLHFKDCLILLFNSISELCTENDSEDFKYSIDKKKNRNEEEKKIDLTVKCFIIFLIKIFNKLYLYRIYTKIAYLQLLIEI
jgi:hypothetical protein